jgi:hypothetical protein
MTTKSVGDISWPRAMSLLKICIENYRQVSFLPIYCVGMTLTSSLIGRFILLIDFGVISSKVKVTLTTRKSLTDQ